MHLIVLIEMLDTLLIYIFVVLGHYCLTLNHTRDLLILIKKIIIFQSIAAWLNVNPYSAGIDFSRQNLTSVDVKHIPAL